jgi:23S rRNA (adenine2503-C2)-methyltransferase
MQANPLTPDPPPDLYALSRAQLGALLSQWGYSDYYAGQLWTALYRDLLTDPAEMGALRPDLQDGLSAGARIGTLRPRLETASSDGYTRKFLLALAQVVFVARLLRDRGEALRNIVLMGMGEPLHNYDATLAAVDTLLDHRGLAIAPRFITLSTVGVVPGIRRLTAERRPIRLAVSLHGATDEARAALVPPARRWPLAELMDACRAYCDALGRRIFFEWTLIEGQNDTAEQAHQLGRLLAGMPAHVNLIPLNPTDGYDGRPAHTPQARVFQAILREYGLPSTVRQRRGIDVAAGCGQLATPSAG